MARISNHLFTVLENTPVYLAKESQTIVGYLPKGSWMGIVSKQSGWLRIMSARIDGWIVDNHGKYQNLDTRDLSVTITNNGLNYLIQDEKQ